MEEYQISILNIIEKRALFCNTTVLFTYVKRIFDVLVSVLCILLFSPIFILTAIAIKLDSPGPIIIFQKRNGYKGEIFTLSKFRTMTSITNKLFREIDSSDEIEYSVFKIKDDERLTRIGKILRKTKIYKLPQLFNVLFGDMSIVGPQPHPINLVMKYDAWYKLRLSVKPGIISLWHTEGKEKVDFEDMVRSDIRYIRERSVIADIKIILESIFLTKRNIDVFCSLVGLILLIPVFLTVALLVKVNSKGKVLFKHKRIGQYGNAFYMYKFRTMVENAEGLIKKFTPDQLIEFQDSFKLKDDPRITPIGRFLRKTSLDELPQILNILKGEMSIVGPRPIVYDELVKYGRYAEKVFSAKPGLTGMWQANGRSNTTYEERVKMDLDYIYNMNLKLDIRIILKTFINVLKHKGAY